MAPRKLESTVPGLFYPTNRDIGLKASIRWMKSKVIDDEAEGLWRIHDKLYDLSNFINLHPGGSDWLTITRGTDITEAFEASHVGTKPPNILKKYYVREAAKPRVYPFTFHPDGFYNVLRKRVREVIKDKPNKPSTSLLILTDSITVLFFTLLFTTCYLQSYLVGFFAGVCLAMVSIIAHNYFHLKDNWRMLTFDLTLLSSFEWRISHALSHHLFANTVQDIEVSALEPLLEFLPNAETTVFKRWLSVFTANLVFCVFFFYDFIRRVYLVLLGEHKVRWENALPFVMYIMMYGIVGDAWQSLYLWLTVHVSSSWYFAFIGLAAAHHHPNIFHDGDTPRKDMDWGLWQVDAVRDRYDITGSQFLVMTTFGDHTLHHLFPTLNHSLLPELYPAFLKTCEEFGIPWRMYSFWELVYGQYCQLLRRKPNMKEPWVAEAQS